ncbi:cupin domain-containing protein [Oscillospiraceae bacterium OttesenSCG-928-G22]|nr:cupin domain-containing protein [Oscillospiraceae bacterium OttesenSCG-928-G22]
MIIRNGTLPVDAQVARRGGEGETVVYPFIDPKDTFNTGRLFARSVLPKGTSIGLHKHEGDFEIYHIISGTATYSDNGEEVTLLPGDTSICPSGSSHAIRNDGEEDLVYIALILYPGK